MSSKMNIRSPVRRINTSTTTCAARQGKLCRCSTCTSSFVSTSTTFSDVSTTCPPSEIDDLESSQDVERPSKARGQPLKAFPTATTIIESDGDYQDNEASAGKFVGPDSCYNPSQNPFNPSPLRAQPFARTDSVSSIASDRTVCSPKANTLKRKKNVLSDATVDNYEHEEPATPLPPLRTLARSIRAQRLAPTRSDYNLTPTPAIPLGRAMNRRRFS